MIKCRNEDQTNIYGVYSEENNFNFNSTSTLFEKKKENCKGTTDTGLQVAFALNQGGTVILSFTNTVKGPLSGD